MIFQKLKQSFPPSVNQLISSSSNSEAKWKRSLLPMKASNKQETPYFPSSLIN